MKTRFPFSVGPWLAMLAGLIGELAVTGPTARAVEFAVARITILAPLSGSKVAAPGPVVFEAEAVDPKGDIRHLDFYANGTRIGSSDFLAKIAVIPGHPIPHRLEWTNLVAGTYKIVARGKDTAGAAVESEAIALQVTAETSKSLTLLAKGSEWRWLYDGTEPAETWKTPAFDATKWKSGKAQLGFGEGDESTVIWTGKAPYPITAYFRGEFQVPADVSFSKLVLGLKRDDGAAVYLNGREIVRDNLPAGSLRSSTLASDATEGAAFRQFTVGASNLVSGRNVLAVEVHQYAATSADLSFDLDLTGMFVVPTTTPPVVRIVATVPETSEPSPTIRVIPGQFTVYRTGSTVAPLKVQLAYGGTAEPGLDYEKLPTTLEIPAGQSEVALNVQFIDDALVEKTESVVAKLVPLMMSGTMGAMVAAYEIDGRNASAEVLVHDSDQGTPPADWLLNVDFGPAMTKVGRAATGLGDADVWNYWNSVGGADLTVEKLRTADGATTSMAVRVRNAGGSWGNKTGDAMYDGYVYPNNGKGDGVGNIVVDLSGVPSGTYDLYLYGHADADGRPESDSVFTVATSDQKYGPKGTASSPGWRVEQGWKEGAQYVVFRGLSVGAPEGLITVVVEPGFDGQMVPDRPDLRVAILNGLQLRRATPTPAPASITITAPKSGASFVSGTTISFSARAVDPAGAITRVAFFDSDRAIGVSQITFIRAPDPGTPIEHALEWKGASIGTHKIVAMGTSAAGTVVVSEPTVIEVVPVTANEAPKVSLVSPKTGTVVALGTVVTVKAQATDADGTIARLEILADGAVVGSADLATLQLDWKASSKGTHKLTARATDNRGKTTTSSAVSVLVVDPATLAFVKRELPAAYLAGAAFDVVLNAAPPKGAMAWIVEDLPPSGWTVGAVSDEGAVDRVSGRVRFGPFTDSTARRLTYRVTPPAQASGVQKFAGTSSLDGKTLPVAGAETIGTAGEFHPADRTPADHVISSDELTAYAAAWKAGKTWGTDGTAIPLTYVTRAAVLWKAGGKYVFAPAKGAPPECWVPASAAAPALAGSVEGTTGSAWRASDAVWVPGVPGTVRLQVAPPTGAVAVSVEEQVPADWTVTRVSEGGVYDPDTGTVRWGPFFGDAARDLGYDAVPPSGTASNADLSGWISFDGGLTPILGRLRIGASGPGTQLRIVSSRRGEGPHVRFGVEAPADQVFQVEASSDLNHWESVGTFLHTGEELDVQDPSATTQAPRYYRLRPSGN